MTRIIRRNVTSPFRFIDFFFEWDTASVNNTEIINLMEENEGFK